MNPWFAKAIFLASNVAIIIIRAPHGKRSRTVEVVKNRRGPLETGLLTLVMVGFLVSLIWVASPAFAFADYPLRPAPFIGGILCLALALWLFYRSHADLGTNWSVTLQVREKHELITRGVYRHVRHPMYLSLLLFSLGQALVVSNWVAGPAYGVAIAILLALRVGTEERMMLEHFGTDYEKYMTRTKRLVPGVW